MENKMTIGLKFIEDILLVECRINLSKSTNHFQFILNQHLKVTRIECNEREIEWSTSRTYYPTFRAESKQIEIEDKDGFNAIFLNYEGPISGWCNFIKENAKALSYYSVWYPQELTEDVTDVLINIENLNDYTVLKADYDERTGNWIYGGKGYDIGNLIAFKKGRYLSEQYRDLTIYYFNSQEKKVVDYIKYYYEDIMTYYLNDLFENSELSKLDIVSLSIKEGGQGGYFRKELIVFTDFLMESLTEKELDLYFAWLMSHELAHHWCTGANEDSWEDWLNETTAECSALLYALKRNNSILFDYIINPKIKDYVELPEIKTPDESRPNGVHVKGTVLFYLVYKKYGVETLEKLIVIFSKLEKKTTDAFLEAIETKLGFEIASLIERNLIVKDFKI